MTLLANASSRVFYPHEIDVLGAAFRRSCETFEQSGDVRFTGRQAHYTREIIAKLILGMARAGERDVDALAHGALSEMNVV
jgi:hypothetical protein